ncbi:hypothetical protein IWW50_001707 [Coemansia erecta]|nr:hypothetical protein GGF43_003515 [Coemansia sp. RSA 2618]KAJ2827802.1 hypothetical protein IWW50_001707 [Coemansia erecta]
MISSSEDFKETRTPTYIAIHTCTTPLKLLYVSSGCRAALGMTPEFIIAQGGTHYIADSFENTDYSHVFADKQLADEDDDSGEDDQASAFMMWLYINNADGTPVLQRILSFKAGNCVVCVNTAYLDAPFNDHHELEVQALDGAMRRMNITQERKTEAERQKNADANRRQQKYARVKYPKTAFVLENPTSIVIETQETGRRAEGPLIAFVTGSVTQLIDADTSDIIRYPFLKLVAPEDVLRVSEYIERLAEASDVQFEKFSLLQRPNVIEGDVFVSDEKNMRVVVESLGAAARDGIMMLLRKVGQKPPPTMATAGLHLHTTACDEDSRGYVSLADIISSDCETTDVGELWT